MKAVTTPFTRFFQFIHGAWKYPFYEVRIILHYSQHSESLIYLASYVTSFTRTYMAQLTLNIVRLSLMMLITVSPNQLVSKVLQIFVPRSECLQVNFQCLINAMKVY